MQIHKTCAHNYVKCKSLFVNLVNINSFDCNVFSVTVLPRLGKKKKRKKMLPADKTLCVVYLTIIPRARMGSESIAHEAEVLLSMLRSDWLSYY